MKKTIKKMTATVVNISYLDHFLKNRNQEDIEYPDSMELVIPDNILKQQNEPNFMDIIESFIYNLITGIQGREVAHCQIWLFDNNDEAEGNR